MDFYYYLAIAYHQAEQPDSVLSVCTKALERVTTDTRKEIVSNFYSIMGDIYHTKKQMKEAYAAYDSALVYNPSNIGTLNNYAYYLSVERRDLDKAEEMSYKTVRPNLTMPLISTHTLGFFLRRATMQKLVSTLIMQ